MRDSGSVADSDAGGDFARAKRRVGGVDDGEQPHVGELLAP